MIVVAALLALWASYELGNRLHAKVEGVKPAQRRGSSSTETPLTRESLGSIVSWSALDDHQLTRLLTESASKTTTADAQDDGTEH